MDRYRYGCQRPRRLRFAGGGWTVWAIVLLAAVPSLGTFAPSTSAAVAPGVAGPRQNSTSTCPVVNYTSTVDDFPLSYFECLPSGFTNSSAYPLAIFLHGVDGSESTPQSGGYQTAFNASWISIASSWGYILLVVNTRTGDGFYINSPYTGPGEQDVWDAIHSEESRHQVSGLYLFGSSMGTMGTFLIAGQDPSAFRAIGGVLTFSDYFEEYQYLEVSRADSTTAGLMAAIDDGLLPNQSATAERMWLALSSPRFDPQNFSHLPMYLVHGGNDIESPNNLEDWPYQQANNTIVNTTCLAATTLAEPANCTQPLTVLHALSPSLYDFRYVYEPTGTHNTDDLNLSDMFAFWAGQVSPGVFWASPSGTPTAPPLDLVNFATVPQDCGTVSFAGAAYTSGGADTVSSGTYAVSASACDGYRLQSLRAVGNGSYSDGTGTLNVSGSTVLVATFVALPPPAHSIVTFSSNPASCTPIEVNGSPVDSGANLAFLNGTYGIIAPVCAGEKFTNWSSSGGAFVVDPYDASTGVLVQANGSVVAQYTAVPPPPTTYTVIVQVEPTGCGSAVTLGGRPYANDSNVSVTPGVYPLDARACPGYTFLSWNVTGSLGVNASTGQLYVSGNGELVARYAANSTAPPSGIGSPSPTSTTAWGTWELGAAVIAIAAVIGAGLFWRRGRRGGAGPSSEP